MSEISTKGRHFLVSFLKSEAWLFSDYADLMGKGEMAWERASLS